MISGKYIQLLTALVIMAVALSSCEHTISIGNTVHADGSLDRTIVLYESDTAHATKNFLGINIRSGWNVNMEPSGTPEEGKQPEVNITFRKHFDSTEDANREMDTPSDSTFNIASSFEKKNRWFYTYLTYTDTYRSLNSFRSVPLDEYFTKEDFEFIERLPAEGAAISKADSLYLERLNEKIFDIYGTRTIFESFYEDLVETMHRDNTPEQWYDSLQRKKENMYQRFIQEEDLENVDFPRLVRSMGIPLSPEGWQSMEKKTREIERRLEFISHAYTGKYVHSINMPGDIVESNADSTVSSQAFWRPPVIKFLLRNYTMSATSRTLNVWAVIVSAVVIGVTLLLFTRRFLITFRQSKAG